MRIAYTIEQCWHRTPGGTAVAAIETARALDAAGDVHLIGVAARHSKPAPPPWTPPIEVRQLPLPRLAMYESWHRLRRPRVERATGPIDVIHATTIAIPPKSAPLAVTMHDLAFLHEPAHFTRRGLSFFNRGLELALENADLVMCSSQATIGDCVAAGFTPTRLEMVPLGVHTAAAPFDEIERVRMRYLLDRPYVLWVGTVEPRKNLPGLLRAFARIDAAVDLVLVGPRGWNEDLSALTANHERIKILGFVPPRDLAPLYAGAEVFCFPSLREGFGFPVLEAMAQGTPVVTSTGTSTEELGRDAAILVDPRSDDEIAEAISSLLEDVALATKLSSAGRERATEYSWTRTAELVAACYAKVGA